MAGIGTANAEELDDGAPEVEAALGDEDAHSAGEEPDGAALSAGGAEQGGTEDAAQAEDATVEDDAVEDDLAATDDDDAAPADDDDAAPADDDVAEPEDSDAVSAGDDATGDAGSSDVTTDDEASVEEDAAPAQAEPAQARSWELTQSAEPTSGATVLPGEVITYTLDAVVTSRQPVTGFTAVVDLSEVLEHASLVGELPRWMTQSGDHLIWDVPRAINRNQPASASFSVVVDDDAVDATLTNVAYPDSAGGQCAECTVTHAVPAPSWELSVESNVAPGSTVLTNTAFVYPMTVQNTSALTVSGAQVVADLSGMMEHADISRVPQDAVFDEDTQMLTWQVPDLAAGESVTERFQVRISAPSRGSEVTAAFSAEGLGGQCVGGCEFAYDVFGFDASLSVDPPAGDVAPGEEISYTFEVENISGGELSGAQVRMNLRDFHAPILGSAELIEPLDEAFDMYGSVIAWNIPDLASGDSEQISFGVRVDEDAEVGAQMLASINTSTARHGGSVVSDNVRHTVAEPAWEVSARAAQANGVTIPNEGTVRPNGQLNYHLTAQNTSGVTISDGVVIADVSGLVDYATIEALGDGAQFDADDEVVRWSVPDLAAEESAAVSFRANLRFADAPNAVLPLSVTTEGPGGECVDGCELVHYATGFEASMTTDPPAGAIEAGDEITYTWQVENTSHAQISGATVTAQLREVFEQAALVEPLDEELRLISIVGPTLMRWDVPDLDAHEAAEVSFSVIVDDDARVGAQLATSITAGAHSFGITYGQSEVTHTVDQLSWEVSARAAQANGVTIPNEGTVRPNGQLNYHITAENTSGLTLSEGAVITDVSGLLPYADIEALTGGAEFDPENGLVRWWAPEVGPGESASFSFRANLRFADAPGAVLPLSVTTQGAGGECVGGCELVHYATAFQASVSADPPSGEVRAGEEITYTWEVQNSSQAQVSGAYVRAQMGDVLAHAEIVEPLPQGVDFSIGTVLNWWVPDLEAGETARVSFTVVVDEDAEQGAELGMTINAGANSFGVSFGEQQVDHTVSVSVTPPTPSLPPVLAVLLGLAKWMFGFLIWLF